MISFITPPSHGLHGPQVDGALRMEHREALRYMRLRADFATARVEGATLEQLFGGSTAVDQVLLGASS